MTYKMSLKNGTITVITLCTLQRPFKIPGLDPSSGFNLFVKILALKSYTLSCNFTKLYIARKWVGATIRKFAHNLFWLCQTFVFLITI